jgi:hypothetical protein
MVYGGWDQPGPISVTVGGGRQKSRLPVISRKGRLEFGHAVALVSYTKQGFIVRNSWERGWGAEGFALLPYEDYFLHVTNMWVAQLGVPLAVDLWSEEGTTDSLSGRYRGSRRIPLLELRTFVVGISNNGGLSQNGDCWTSEEDLARLFHKFTPNKARRWAGTSSG